MWCSTRARRSWSLATAASGSAFNLISRRWTGALSSAAWRWPWPTYAAAGEYGEAGPRSGNLEHKQNVFDDFAAVLEHLVARKYTEPSRIVIQGGSNGGLLMGALLTQHPNLVKAVVASVGIYDTPRVELSSNGTFNVPEFGTGRTPSSSRPCTLSNTN